MGIEGRERMQATVYAAERICASRFLVIGEDGDLIRALKNRQALTVDESIPVEGIFGLGSSLVIFRI
jgi:hypothetical protein